MTLLRPALVLLFLSGLACEPTSGTLGGGTPPGDDDDAADDDDATPDERRDDGRLDLTDLRPAFVGVNYIARLGVQEYDGEAVFTIRRGDVPPGMSLTRDGRFLGLPEQEGEFAFQVEVADMTDFQDFLEWVEFDVGPSPQPDRFLGLARPWLNNFWYDRGQMGDLWVRVHDGGIPAMWTQTLEPGIYSAGPNGQPEYGLGDDVLVEPLPLSSVTVEVEEFEYTREADPGGPSYPSGHYNEDDPVSYDAQTGVFTAGADTGQAGFTVTHAEHGIVESRVMVVPPDWCPAGIAWTVCE